MSFVDELKKYNLEKEIDARRKHVLDVIILSAEDAVKHDSVVATRKGINVISGYLGYHGGYDVDGYNCLLTASNNGDSYIRIDCMTDSYTCVYEKDSEVPSCLKVKNLKVSNQIMLTHQEMNYIVDSACEKIAKLGFVNYTVTKEQREFFAKERYKGFFGNDKTRMVSVGVGTLLKIEVQW